MKWSSALRGESNQTGSNLLKQVDDRKESNVEQPELFKLKSTDYPNKAAPHREYSQPPLVQAQVHKLNPPNDPRASARTLKIEADGDSWKGLVKPKIRLMGRWLERAGFIPGNRVSVTYVAPGHLELRSTETITRAC